MQKTRRLLVSIATGLTRCTLLAVALLALTPAHARAVIVEHVFTGQITEQSAAVLQVQVGDPFTAELRFNTAETPVFIGGVALYNDFTFELQVSGLVFPGFQPNNLAVSNDPITGDAFVIDHVEGGTAGFGLADPTGTAFDSFALPTVLDLTDFASKVVLVIPDVPLADFIRGEI